MSQRLITARTLIAACAVLVMHSAAPQDAVYNLPSANGLDALKSEDLAARLRELNHSFIDVLPWIRQHRVTRWLNDSGQVRQVVAKNADRWEKEFMTRHAAFVRAANARGYRDISGTYTVRMEPPNCSLQNPPPSTAVVEQSGSEFVAKFSPGIRLSGTIVEDTVDFPLYGGTQPNPYFKGAATDQAIRLTNGALCQVELVKN